MTSINHGGLMRLKLPAIIKTDTDLLMDESLFIFNGNHCEYFIYPHSYLPKLGKWQPFNVGNLFPSPKHIKQSVQFSRYIEKTSHLLTPDCITLMTCYTQFNLILSSILINISFNNCVSIKPPLFLAKFWNSFLQVFLSKH